jgi:DNA-binding CsgD family transcriptional regulator
MATDHDLIFKLYEAAGNPAAWQPFLDAFVETYPGGKGGFVLHDLAAQEGVLELGSGWTEEDLTAYHGHFSNVNPWLANIHKATLGVAYNAELLCARRDLQRTEFHADWLRPVKVGAGNGVVLQQDASRFMVLTTLYPERTEERDPDVVGRLQRLAPHVLRVAQINRQLALLETRAKLAEAALGGQHAAMLLVSAQGELLQVDEAGERLLAAGDGLRLAGKRLEAAQPAQTALLHRLIGEAARALDEIGVPPGGMVRLARKSGRPAFEVLVGPAPHRVPRGSFGCPMAVLLVKDPEARPVVRSEDLRRLYGLTRKEARLMTALMTEDTIETAAERFGVSRETLRTQLKSVFLKTGTSTQVELVRLGMSGPLR